MHQILIMKKVGIIQLCSKPDITHNFNVISRFFQKAKSSNVDMVFLPEAFAFLGDAGTSFGMSGPVDGDLFSRYRHLCREHQLWASFGGFHQRSKESDTKVSNTHIIINDSGDVVSQYKKIHLFDVEYPRVFRESDSALAGSELVVCPSPIGNLGLTICYDLRFPVQFQKLVDMGAQVLLVPAAFTVKTGEAHWHTLLRARAIETGSWVIAAAQCGNHSATRSSFGHSLVINPWGEVVLDMDNEEELAVIDIDLKHSEKVRSMIPCLKNRLEGIDF